MARPLTPVGVIAQEVPRSLPLLQQQQLRPGRHLLQEALPHPGRAPVQYRESSVSPNKFVEPASSDAFFTQDRPRYSAVA